MFKLLQKLLSGGPYYVRIRSQRLSVRDVNRGGVFEELPLMAISEEPRPAILAIGAGAELAARRSGKPFRLVNPFDHPRTALADFQVAEKLLIHAFLQLHDSQLMRPSPIVVMHPLEHLEGGLTQIEVRALMELAAGAGARKVHVWQGRELLDQEIRDGRFPEGTWEPGPPRWGRNG